MTDGAGRLHMVRLGLDAARLAALEGDLPQRQEDAGILVHRLLSRLFGKGAVQPFHIASTPQKADPADRHIDVLGYTRSGQDELDQHVSAFADPEDYAACNWPRFAIKPMPGDWDEGQRLGFEVRICPVVRLSTEIQVTDKDGSPQHYPAGAEVDAWVHRRFLRPREDDDHPNREQVYREWLADRLQSEARIETARLRSFRRSRLVRQTQGEDRRARVLERPDTIVEGTLAVVDGHAFTERLAKGVGRHAAFGFGMLLLKPPPS